MLLAHVPGKYARSGARRRLALGPAERALVTVDEVGEQLAGWGVAVRLETRGRRTGRSVGVAVGYVEEADGSLVVAAGSPDADWARNLEADPRCRATVGDRTFDAIAEPLDPTVAAAAVTSLILKYGTPAEGLGRGPAFRIRPSPEVR